jgi:hypothetical protein
MNFMDRFFETFFDLLLALPRFIFSLIVDACIAIVDLLPEPDVADIQAVFDAIPNELVYFLDMFEFGYGLTAIFGALAARFILRRIPVIG